jgi:peptidylprolyl isomerase/peptidyl-prolyl cis-trans isomerase C
MNPVANSNRWSPLPLTRLGAAVIAMLVLPLATTGSIVGHAATDDPLIAVVNGTEIRESDVRLADQDLGRAILTKDPVERRDQLVAILTDTIIFSKYASDQKIGDDPDIERRVAFTRNKALMEKVLETTGRHAVTEEAIRKAYEEFVLKANIEPELRLRSVQFRFSDPNDKAAVKDAEEKAKAAYKRLSKGEDFAAVVSSVSENANAKSNGGDLGFMTRAEMGKEYAEVAFSLEKGGISQPIKTQFGWHIIKLEDKRVRKPMDFEVVRDRLTTFVARKAQLDLVNKLRAEAKIERQGGSNQAEGLKK